MTKAEALYTFWASFGLPAFDENSVPSGDNAPDLPYITYETRTGAFEDVLPISGDIWYRSRTWTDISAKVEQIAQATAPYYLERFDGGFLWITQGPQFAQRLSDPDDDTIKRIHINLTAEFFSRS
jgi:hypothetical protein